MEGKMSISKFKPDTSTQSLIIGYNIDDFISTDHITRLIDEIVEELDTRKIEDKYSWQGQKSYSPKSLIKIIFYGYTIGVLSSRKIRNGCKQDLGFIYLARLYRPDFRTISDFRKNNIEELGEYFVAILKYCNELGLLKLGKIVIDGSKFRANASVKRSKDLKKYEEWEKKLQKEIALLNAESEKIDKEENERLSDPKTDGSEILKKIRKKGELINKIKEAKEKVKKVEEEYAAKKIKRKAKINLTDEDANIQKESGGIKKPGYNGQIAVNEDQIIIAAELTKTQEDSKELIPMIEAVEINTGEKVEEVKADSGYGNCANYEDLEERKIDGYVPDSGFKKLEEAKENGTLKPYDKNNFQYDEKNDKYVCPQGKDLEFIKEVKHDNREDVKIYKCKSCNECEARKICANDKNRIIERMINESCRDRMRDKLRSDEGKKKYKERSGLVEPPFGHMKMNIKFRQFLLRGLTKVRGEFKLICIGFNLMKIYNLKLAKVKM